MRKSGDELVELSPSDEDTLRTEVNADKKRLEYQFDREGRATFRLDNLSGLSHCLMDRRSR